MFVPRKVADSYREMINSIGFYPSLFSIGFLLFAIITMSLEYVAPVEQIKSFI